MGTYQDIIKTIQDPKQCAEERQKTIKEIEQITKRRLLVYVADIRKFPGSILEPNDKMGFSDLIQDVNEKEVDFLINSPGGFAEVTESLVSMLRSKFKSIRFVVPNMAKSAASLLALSGNAILMDHRGELGPIDPQVEYTSIDGRKREAAEDILDGFDEAKKALKDEGPAATPAYVPLLSKYTIGLLRGCINALKLSKTLARDWLRKYMFCDEGENSTKAEDVAEFFGSHKNTLSHNRSIPIDKCIELELKIEDLRKSEHKELADKFWKLWCLYNLHFERGPVTKMYENSSGCTLEIAAVQIQVPIPPGRIQFPPPGQQQPPSQPPSPQS